MKNLNIFLYKTIKKKNYEKSVINIDKKIIKFDINDILFKMDKGLYV